MKYSTNRYVEEIQKGKRRFIAKAITLLESTLPQQFEQGWQILEKLMPNTGNSIRIGITGVPGVGKSTFIETLGLRLTEQGHRLAVLPIDPSSSISGGSIMADKTRMSHLSSHPQVYIRPSPSQGILGGVAPKTKESILICEAAGYDIIFVETVGVGQSETAVASMVDFFLVLMLSNTGDELQGIKKGILEMADLIVINKADGENIHSALRAAAEYRKALQFLSPSRSSWTPQVLTCSALQATGLDELWAEILKFREKTIASGAWQQRRQTQLSSWMWQFIEEELHFRFRTHPQIAAMLPAIEQSVHEGKQPSINAARKLLDTWWSTLRR